MLNHLDADYGRVRAELATDRGPFIVPMAIMSEAAYIIEHRLLPLAIMTFLEDLESGEFVIDCGAGDLRRIRELIKRYADFPLGFSDAAVVACAERNGGRVLTLDQR